MKAKLLAGIFAIVLALSLAACGDSAVDSVLDDLDIDGEEEEYVIEVPESILNLSEEEDILLGGELKDGVYINNYFGYQFTAPAGTKLVRDNDEATGSSTYLPMKQAYEDGWGGICISADLEFGTRLSVSIIPQTGAESGLDEEGMVKKHIEDVKALDQAFGDEEDDGPVLEIVSLAGEEHPASVSRTETEDEGLKISESLYIVKGDFVYYISLFGTEAQIAEYLKCFDKL